MLPINEAPRARKPLKSASSRNVPAVEKSQGKDWVLTAAVIMKSKKAAPRYLIRKGTERWSWKMALENAFSGERSVLKKEANIEGGSSSASAFSRLFASSSLSMTMGFRASRSISPVSMADILPSDEGKSGAAASSPGAGGGLGVPGFFSAGDGGAAGFGRGEDLEVFEVVLAESLPSIEPSTPIFNPD